MQYSLPDSSKMLPVQRTLSVKACGVAEAHPDIAHLLLTVRSEKNNASEAKNSVERRLQYIFQVIHNSHLKESDYKSFDSVQHIGDSHEFKSEIYLCSNEAAKLSAVSETLAKKLESGVFISDITYSTSKKLFDYISTQSASNAIQNAKRKAAEMARLLDGVLGGPLSVEQISSEQTSLPHLFSRLKETQFANWNEASLCVTSHVCIIFELKQKKKT